MKNSILFLLLIASLTVSGQNYDSLKTRILALEMEQTNVQINLDKAHQQYRFGTFFQILGAATGIFGGVIMSKDAEGSFKRNPIGDYFIYGGAAMMTAGTVLHIDSHKWIGRAGKRKTFKR